MLIRMLFIQLLLTGTFSFAVDFDNRPLSHAQQAELDSLCSSFPVSLCGPGSIADYSRADKFCIIARHLTEFARWLVSEGISYDNCFKDLARRYDCLSTTHKSPIDTAHLSVSGNVKAPVTIVVYVFDMCPACTYLYFRLYGEVTNGALKGKVRLAAKLFDKRADSTVKVRFSKFWNYIAALTIPVTRKDEPSPVFVADTGNNFPTAYKKTADDLKLRINPVTFREEGSKESSVNPPIFINGKRYRSYNNPRWIVDAALYEFETMHKPVRYDFDLRNTREK